MSEKVTVVVSAEVWGRVTFEVEMTKEEFDKWDSAEDRKLNEEMESRAPWDDLDVTDFEVDDFFIQDKA